MASPVQSPILPGPAAPQAVKAPAKQRAKAVSVSLRDDAPFKGRLSRARGGIDSKQESDPARPRAVAAEKTPRPGKGRKAEMRRGAAKKEQAATEPQRQSRPEAVEGNAALDGMDAQVSVEDAATPEAPEGSQEQFPPEQIAQTDVAQTNVLTAAPPDGTTAQALPAPTVREQSAPPDAQVNAQEAAPRPAPGRRIEAVAPETIAAGAESPDGPAIEQQPQAMEKAEATRVSPDRPGKSEQRAEALQHVTGAGEEPALPATAAEHVDPHPAPAVVEATARPAAKMTAPQPAFRERLQQPAPAISDRNASAADAADVRQLVESFQQIFADLIAPAEPESIVAGEPREPAAQLAIGGESTVVHPQPHVAQEPPGAAPARAESTPESRFAEANHQRIVTAVRTELLPSGGAMHIRLDPPELGALQVRVEMRDGAVTAAFQTSSDQATQLLSHSLGQLKHALESQGISVEKLQVERAPQDHRPGASGDDARQQHHEQSAQQQQEQLRRELLRRMWRRLSGGADPLDVLA